MCFYLPPLLTGKTALVVTPTISLMSDQVSKLENKGIAATLLGSAQGDKNVFQKVAEGKYSLVFATPETVINRCTSQPQRVFTQMAQKGKLCMVALDEAHLIDTWKNFKWAYAWSCV